jgi:predicted ArsR family transcriptional regulator
MQDIGETIADGAALADASDFEGRMSAIVAFLNEQGYLARWEKRDGDAYLLHIANCPYEQVALNHHEVCAIDMALLTSLLSVKPKRVKWSVGDERQCTYTIQPPNK